MRFPLLALGSFLFLTQALAVPNFEVQRIKSRERSAFATTQTNSWKWFLNADKVKTLWAFSKFSSEEFAKYSAVKAVGKDTRVALKGKELVVLSNKLLEGVLFTGAGPDKLGLQLSYKTPVSTVEDDNCRKLRVVLQSAAEFPFFLGTSCKVKDGSVALSLTIPPEVKVAESSLTEVRKGEFWRLFELGKIRPTNETLGRFKLVYRSKTFDFTLDTVSESAARSVASVSSHQTVTSSSHRLLVAGGLGYTFLGINNSIGTSPSDSKPALVLRAPHFPLYKGLGVAAAADFAIPLTSTDAISYLQLEGAVGYEFSVGSSLRIRPKVEVVYSSTNHADSNTGLTLSQLGLGGTVEYRISDFYFLTLDGMTTGFGGGALQSHLSLEMSFVYKAPGSFGYGAGFRYQSFSAIGTLGIERSFNQNTAYLLVAF